LGVAAYHYGPGQQRLTVDDAAALLRAADGAAKDGHWAEAVEKYDAALALLPTERIDVIQSTRIERAKAQMMSGLLPEAHGDLTALVDEIKADPNAGPALLADARSTLANAQYYMTWLMRLEGSAREDWEPHIEAARQNYRLLAEGDSPSTSQGLSPSAADNTAAQHHREDLESAIRLARMDLSDLQALPLPKQCSGCCSGKGVCRGKGKGATKDKKEGPDARGASSGPPPDGRGS
jgi:hypothetical protein